MNLQTETRADGRNRPLWQVGLQAECGRDWVVVRVMSGDGARGQAWAPHSDCLRETLEEVLRPATGGGTSEFVPIDSACVENGRMRLLARGLVASAHTDLLSRRYTVPLHVWLGGPLRREIQVTWPVVFAAGPRQAHSALAEPGIASALEAAEALGITSFAIHDASHDIDAISLSVRAVRKALGPEPTLSLRLAGQFDAAGARALLSNLRSSNLICVTDPCASVGMNVEAARDQLPALGLSASRYDRQALLRCLAETPPAVLLIDPLLEGGPAAVRQLASIARVFQSDVSLTAEDGGTWLIGLCAELAAVIPASHRPMELPTGLTIGALHGLGVAAGALRLPASASISPGRRVLDDPRGFDNAVTSSLTP